MRRCMHAWMDAYLLECRGILLLETGSTILFIAGQAPRDAAALAEERPILRHHLVALRPHVRQLLCLFHGVAQQRVPAHHIIESNHQLREWTNCTIPTRSAENQDEHLVQCTTRGEVLE